MNVSLSNISMNNTVFNSKYSARQRVLELQLFGHKLISFLGGHQLVLREGVSNMLTVSRDIWH